jgi:hypothetical protein
VFIYLYVYPIWHFTVLCLDRFGDFANVFCCFVFLFCNISSVLINMFCVFHFFLQIFVCVLGYHICSSICSYSLLNFHFVLEIHYYFFIVQCFVFCLFLKFIFCDYRVKLYRSLSILLIKETR